MERQKNPKKKTTNMNRNENINKYTKQVSGKNVLNIFVTLNASAHNSKTVKYYYYSKCSVFYCKI